MIIDTLHDIVTSPFIQFFLLAILAGLAKSDLNIPDQVTKALSMYLMLAIGLKGGLAISNSPVPISEIALVLLAGVFLSFLIPFLGYSLIRLTTNLSRLDSAAIAAHYGSVSVVTFSYAVAYLHGKGYSHAGYVVTLMAFMEAPAIITGLLLAKGSQRLKPGAKRRLLSPEVLRDVAFNSSVVLLLGGLMIGITAEKQAMEGLQPYLIKPFYAVLCIFLIDLGLITARQFKNLKIFPLPLILYCLYMPLTSMVIGIGMAALLGLQVPEMMLFATLCASASYIAVPAAMRIALPEANPALYVTCSLAITFPFNLIVGIPLYFQVANWISG
jgi:hypothetical protein